MWVCRVKVHDRNERADLILTDELDLDTQWGENYIKLSERVYRRNCDSEIQYN